MKLNPKFKELFLAESHPFKHEFKKYGIPQSAICGKTGLRPWSLSRWLNGVDKMPSGVESELASLLDEIKLIDANQ